jgi:methionyl-tRNA formyltransferase
MFQTAEVRRGADALAALRMRNVLILGSTDLTLDVANAVEASGARVAAIASVGETFQISYSPTAVKNSRWADTPGWCRDHGARAIPYTDVPALARDIAGEEYAVCILAGWYHMVPASFRALFPRGCLGFHASLLPQLRGGAPLNWAILSELTETGVTLFEVGTGVDEGGIYDQERFPIGPDTYVSDLVAATGRSTAEMVRRSLPAILSGDLKPRPQIGSPSYGAQRRPEDGRIDWRQPAVAIARLVRAVSRPYPGALTILDGRQIAIHRVRLAPGAWDKPGQVLDDGQTVVCGSGALTVTEAVFEDGASAIPALYAGAQLGANSIS